MSRRRRGAASTPIMCSIPGRRPRRVWCYSECLLWVRCEGRRQAALKAALHLLARCPGLAMVALDVRRLRRLDSLSPPPSVLAGPPPIGCRPLVRSAPGPRIVGARPRCRSRSRRELRVRAGRGQAPAGSRGCHRIPQQVANKVPPPRAPSSGCGVDGVSRLALLRWCRLRGGGPGRCEPRCASLPWPRSHRGATGHHLLWRRMREPTGRRNQARLGARYAEDPVSLPDARETASVSLPAEAAARRAASTRRP